MERVGNTAAEKDERQPVGQTISVQPKYNIAAGQKTRGEKLFDSSLYIGLGYIINLVSSIAITEFMLHGKGKTAIWDPTEKALMKGLMKAGLSQEAALKSSQATQECIWLTSGGTALMIPTKLIEDRKSKLVYLLNRSFFPNTIAADDPYRSLSASQILSGKFDENCLPQPEKEQPKNSWTNTVLRRLLGFGLVVGWGNAVQATYGKKNYERDINNAINKGVEATKSPLISKLYENERTKRFALWTVVDGVNTLITSVTTFFTSGAKEKSAEEKREEANIPHDPASCLPVKKHETKPEAELKDYETPYPSLVTDSVQANRFGKDFEQAIHPHEHKHQHGHKHHAHDALRVKDDGYAPAIAKQHQASLDSPSLSA